MSLTTLHAYDLTGKPLATVATEYWHAYSALVGHIAEQFGADADQVRLDEDDDGVEWLTVAGKRVGYLTQEISGQSFGVTPDPITTIYHEAAE